MSKQEAVKDKRGRFSKQDTEEYIGRVDFPFKCGGASLLEVRDFNDDLVYSLKSKKSCPVGLDCHCPCGTCRYIEFEIYDSEGNMVGRVTKEWKSCSRKEGRDKVEIEIKDKASWQERALLIGAVLELNALNLVDK